MMSYRLALAAHLRTGDMVDDGWAGRTVAAVGSIDGVPTVLFADGTRWYPGRGATTRRYRPGQVERKAT